MKEWKDGNMANGKVLMGADGTFGISYSLPESVIGESTALVSMVGDVFCVEGDQRAAYEAVIDNGFAACKELYDSLPDKILPDEV